MFMTLGLGTLRILREGGKAQQWRACCKGEHWCVHRSEALGLPPFLLSEGPHS